MLLKIILSLGLLAGMIILAACGETADSQSSVTISHCYRVGGDIIRC